MPRVEGEIVIHRPIEEVFDFIADEQNEPRYNPRMLRAEKVSDGPIGVGTTWNAVMKSGRRTAEMVIEVTAYERPRRLASSTHVADMDIRGTLTFEAEVGGPTRMRWSWDLQPHGVLKLMTPIVAGMGRRQERAIWLNLKHLLEAPSSSLPRLRP